MDGWIGAIVANGKGKKAFHQFGDEEELRYFLACNEDRGLERATYHED